MLNHGDLLEMERRYKEKMRETSCCSGCTSFWIWVICFIIALLPALGLYLYVKYARDISHFWLVLVVIAIVSFLWTGFFFSCIYHSCAEVDSPKFFSPYRGCFELCCSKSETIETQEYRPGRAARPGYTTTEGGYWATEKENYNTVDIENYRTGKMDEGVVSVKKRRWVPERKVEVPPTEATEGGYVKTKKKVRYCRSEKIKKPLSESYSSTVSSSYYSSYV